MRAMTGEQRDQIKRVLNAALDLDEPQRSAYIEEACAKDPELRRELQEILEGRGPSKGFLVDDTSGGLAHVFREGEMVAGRFRVVRFRGRGGMGEVYECWDERLRLKVGLKTIRSDWRPDSDARERFNREILVAREVSHPNLCRVFDMIEHVQPDGAAIICLTMEWLEGETLQSVLERERPMTPEAALPILRQVAAALDALHAARIVHRDLKPGNIMLVKHGDGSTRAVVTDFGLAKPLEDREWFESRTDAAAGAPYFMAPEQLRNEKSTAASDIYAFGLVMDEMVTRTRAFDAESVGALFYQRLWETPTRPSSRSEGLPERWETVILRCLEKAPPQRFSRAGDCVSVLDGSSVAVPAPEAANMPPRRWGIRAAFAGGGCLALLMLVSRATSGVPTGVEVFDIERDGSKPELEYLCKGTTAEILRRLTQLEGVRVVPLRATRKQAGKRTGGNLQLDGALLNENGRVRLSMSLEDSRDGSVPWSDVFDGKSLSDSVGFQTSIAAGVAAALEREVLLRGWKGRAPEMVASLLAPVRGVFGKEFTGQVAKPPTSDSTALDYYMRGSKLLEENNAMSARAAMDYYDRALARDPMFALAMSAQADAFIWLKSNDVGNAPSHLQKARALAERAALIDPKLAEAHTSLAAVRQADWDWEGSEQSYLESMRLKPSYSRAHRWYAGLLLQFGRFDQALGHARKAMELEPHDRSQPVGYGGYLFLAGRNEEALSVLEQALKEFPTESARFNLALVHARMGALRPGEQARAHYGRAIELAEAIRRAAQQSDDPGAAARCDEVFALVHSLAGDRVAADPYLRRMRSTFHNFRSRAVPVAGVLTVQGRKAEALSVLEEAVAYRDTSLLYVRVMPFLEGLRGEPGYQAILTQLRL